jgi:hypothetical protein
MEIINRGYEEQAAYFLANPALSDSDVPYAFLREIVAADGPRVNVARNHRGLRHVAVDRSETLRDQFAREGRYENYEMDATTQQEWNVVSNASKFATPDRRGSVLQTQAKSFTGSGVLDGEEDIPGGEYGRYGAIGSERNARLSMASVASSELAEMTEDELMNAAGAELYQILCV